MPELSNVVFMGMEMPGRNLNEVEKAARTLVDRQRLCMAASKVTISSVGPSPEAFMRLANIPGTMARSLHSPNDAVRRALVPSTRHTTVELRDGLGRSRHKKEFTHAHHHDRVYFDRWHQ